MDEPVIRRAQVHAALAEPHRLAIVDELAVSDRSPAELAAIGGLSTSLLAHHLEVLEAADLIERFVSSGDRRRRYIRLRRAPLRDLAIAPAAADGEVLFVCSRNSARSQLAAALWTRHRGEPATSAGTHPAERVHPGTLAAARRNGLELGDATPTLLPDAVTATTVVTVCDQAHEALGAPASWWHWSVPDPVESGSDEAFDAVVDHLDARIRSIRSPEESESP